MTEYSVLTTNRFALSIDDDEDPHEVLEQNLAEKKRKAELAAEMAAQAKNAANMNNKGKTDKKNLNKTAVKRNVKSASQPNVPQKTNTRNDENRPPRLAYKSRDNQGTNLNFEKPPQNFDRERRGGYGGRGRGGSRGGFARGKRDYDRHSGSDKTGIKPVEKREGSGPHNWGDEIQSQLEHTGDQSTEGTAEVVENGVDKENESSEVVEREVSDEPKQMTLDEWKASQTKVKAEFKVRKANEGADAKQWKGTVALEKKKKDDVSEDEYEEDSDDEVAVDNTKTALQKLNIEVNFGDQSRSRGRGQSGFRGSRDGNRGGNFRGRGRDEGFGPREGEATEENQEGGERRENFRDGERRGNFRGGNRGGRSRGGFNRGGNNSRDGYSRGGDKKKAVVPQVNNEDDFPSLGSR